MTTLLSRTKQLPLFLACLIVSLAVLANSASHWYEENYPEVAIRFDPSNSEARIRITEIALERASEDADFPALIETIRTGIYYEPYNPKLYSLLGLLSISAGMAPDDAQDLFKHALALNGADIRALLSRFAYTASRNEIEEAVQLAELIFRGWPEQWQLVEPYLPALLGNKAGYAVARARFAELPGGPSRMLASLSKTDTGLYFARKLLLDWRQDGVGELRSSINIIVGRLLASKQYNEAFLLNSLTMSGQEKAETGYIFNKEFNLKPNGSPFDWALPKLPGVSFSMVATTSHSSGEAGDAKGQALEIKFLNSPVRLTTRLQTLRLPSAQFSWSVSYSTRNLRGPKPVELKIRCLPGAKTLASLVLDPSDGKVSAVKTAVEVPGRGDCPLQEIIVTNNNIVESWQNRYSGSVYLHATDMRLDQ
jgi:tetratricopeptide (TPR) repeat protein